jgi:hypothetical protein
MHVIENGKLRCPECKELVDFKIFDIPKSESILMCTNCHKVQTEKTLMDAEIEFQTKEAIRKYKEMYPDGIMQMIAYNRLKDSIGDINDNAIYHKNK